MDGKLLARARERQTALRDKNAAEQSSRQNRIYALIPEIGDIDVMLRTRMSELIAATVRGGAGTAETVREIEAESLALTARKSELLTRHGFPADYLDGVYSCPDCRDTGYVGGRMCACLKTLYNEELTQELGTLLKSSDECFEKFDLSLYGAARESMEIVFDTCREYAASFSERSVNLMLQGGTGLGKTFLSACIARVVAGKGFSVCYDSAAAALEAFETKKFSRDPDRAERAAERVSRMLECDLMILDDLGTEMPTPMSVSALYTLLNTRLVNGKKTVVSTNLSDAELNRRYTPQICSRLDGEFIRLPFYGSDIRILRKDV